MKKLIINQIERTYRTLTSVKSINPCKSVIQTSYDIVKAHGGELKVESPPAGLSAHKEGEGSEFIIQIPNTVDKTARP